MANDTSPQNESEQETEESADTSGIGTPEVAAAWRHPTTHAYISRIKEPREYNLFREEYYSSSDTQIYFDDVEQREIGYIQYSVQEQLKPLYGYASNTWDDVAIGNRIVTGVFKVPIRNIEVRNYGDKLTNPAFGEVNEITSYQGPIATFDPVAYNEEETKKLQEQPWIDTATPGGSATKDGMPIGDLRKSEYEEENEKLKEDGQEQEDKDPLVPSLQNHKEEDKKPLGPFLQDYWDKMTEEEKKKFTEAAKKTIGDEYKDDDKVKQLPWGLILQNYYNSLTEEEKKRASEAIDQIEEEGSKDKGKPMSAGDLLEDYYSNLPEEEKKRLMDKYKNTDSNKPQPEPTPTEPNNDDLVPVQQYSNIGYDLRYATKNNFTGKVVYQDIHVPSIRYGTLKKLIKVQEKLKSQGFKLKIWDAYRPHSAQWALWEASGKNSTYVADPNKGPRGHACGNIVDVTLVDLNERPVEMPTDFDNFTEKAGAYYNGSDISETAKRNREILQNAMTECGFNIYSAEWWHFTDSDYYEAIDDT